MRYHGFVIHDSRCPNLNGKGFDYRITRDGHIIPSPEMYGIRFIHICVDGDFSVPPSECPDRSREEQSFILQKLILHLSRLYAIPSGHVYLHHENCPGKHFPWSKLVISPQDRYH